MSNGSFADVSEFLEGQPVSEMKDVSEDVDKAIGTAQALAERMHLALGYATVWDNKAELLRLLRATRHDLGLMADELLKATGRRDPSIPYEMDPDWIEDDQAYNRKGDAA